MAAQRPVTEAGRIPFAAPVPEYPSGRGKRDAATHEGELSLRRHRNGLGYRSTRAWRSTRTSLRCRPIMADERTLGSGVASGVQERDRPTSVRGDGSNHAAPSSGAVARDGLLRVEPVGLRNLIGLKRQCG